MQRGQVLVRGKLPDGSWGGVDVLDLDEKSFRAFVIEMLIRASIVYSLKEPEGENITYEAKPVLTPPPTEGEPK